MRRFLTRSLLAFEGEMISATQSGRTWTTVEFSDLRFDYAFLPARSSASRAPLGGSVYIVDGKDDAGEAMGGREQH